LFAAGAIAAQPPANHRNFVACPIVRDTSTVPCWLSEYEGEIYYLTIQTDVSAPVNPPWLGHKVLVEGVVSDKPRVCGGIPLESLTLSVLPKLDPSCNTLLPAEDRYDLPFEPPRPPGPSAGRLAFGDPVMRSEVKAVEQQRTFTLQYDFDGKVVFRHAQSLQQIFEYVKQTGAKHIEITGFRAASLLSNGTVMTEDETIGRRRAEQVAELLRGAGLTDVHYEVRWKDEVGRANGIDDAARRKAEVVVRLAEPTDQEAN
jgi:hypothetical protein